VAEQFKSVYAGSYDRIYSEKDYAAECDMLERIFHEHAAKPVRSVLDLGCGTGNHALPLAARGYEVVGVDLSDNMLSEARRKLQALTAETAPVFQHGDIRNIDLGRTFDAALLMFAVIGYQIENADVLTTLRTARKHLCQGGLLVMDFWYGPAVLTERPGDRLKVVPTDTGQIIRAASGKLDTRRNLCVVRYHLWELEGDRLKRETVETHTMRYFFQSELELFLEQAGLSLIRLGAFMMPEQVPDEKTWNVLAISRVI
jgi:SAM-dependent methyltransferase